MISIIIPTFNEEKRLKKSLEKLLDFLTHFSKETEILVVDDGSKDATLETAKEFETKFSNFKILQHQQNQGKGAAVKTGFLQAQGEIVVFTDADFSTPISELPKLLTKLDEGYDIAIGSRGLDRSLTKVHQNFLREYIGRAGNILIQLLAVRGVSDTQCGFKAFKKNACRKIFEKQSVERFTFDVELLFLAQRQGLKIAEVPVLWFNDPASKVHPIKDTLQSLLDLFRIRMIHASNKGSLFERFLFLLNKRKTFLKFGLVGLSGTILDYSAYFLLTRIGNFAPLEANPISVELAIIWNFSLNNVWTFSGRNLQRHLFKKFLAFQIVSVGGLVLSQMQILILTHFLGVLDLIAKALSIPVVALFNYFINSRWTFRSRTVAKSVNFAYLFLIASLFVVYLFLVKEITGSFNLFVDR